MLFDAIAIDSRKAKNIKGETLIGGDYKWEVRTRAD